jgi:hypothetical protein
MATLVYRYGTPSRVVTPPEVIEQMHLAHQLRNALVALTHQQEQAMRDLWSQYPAVAATEARLAEAEDRAEQLAKQARAEHSVDRTIATRPQTSAELRAARAEAKAAKTARRAAIGEAYLLAKPAIERIRADYKAAVKATYAEFVQRRGLYWATYNAVVDDHRVAVKRVEQSHKQGQPAQLRFHRWTGEGTITVQLQREAGAPARTPALLASGEGRWRNVFQLRPWLPDEQWSRMSRAEQRSAGHGEAMFCVGSGRTVTIPVQVHRMMPTDADVAMVQLTRRRVAGKWSLSVAVTVRVPDPEPVTSGPVVAFHTGWRSRADGGVRVATWAASAPLHVPDHLADLVVAYDGGRWGEVVARPSRSGPGRWMGAVGNPDQVRSVRDVAFDQVRDKVAAWLDEHPQPDPHPDDPERMLTGAWVRTWRSPSRLAGLTLRWREAPPSDAGDLLVLLEAWRRQDRHLWESESHERAQMTAGRDDAWRRVGAWLAGQAGLLVVDDADMATLRRRGDAADDDPVLPGVAADVARARAAALAPGRLRQFVAAAAARRGVEVRVVSAAGLTRTHGVCGHVGDRDARYAVSAVVVCPGCGGAYDQDRNSAVLMVSSVSDSVAATA